MNINIMGYSLVKHFAVTRNRRVLPEYYSDRPDRCSLLQERQRAQKLRLRAQSLSNCNGAFIAPGMYKILFSFTIVHDKSTVWHHSITNCAMFKFVQCYPSSSQKHPMSFNVLFMILLCVKFGVRQLFKITTCFF